MTGKQPFSSLSDKAKEAIAKFAAVRIAYYATQGIFLPVFGNDTYNLFLAVVGQQGWKLTHFSTNRSCEVEVPSEANPQVKISKTITSSIPMFLLELGNGRGCVGSHLYHPSTVRFVDSVELAVRKDVKLDNVRKLGFPVEYTSSHFNPQLYLNSFGEITLEGVTTGDRS